MPISIDAKAMITGETQSMINLVANKGAEGAIGVQRPATPTLLGVALTRPQMR